MVGGGGSVNGCSAIRAVTAETWHAQVLCDVSSALLLDTVVDVIPGPHSQRDDN